MGKKEDKKLQGIKGTVFQLNHLLADLDQTHTIIEGKSESLNSAVDSLRNALDSIEETIGSLEEIQDD